MVGGESFRILSNEEKSRYEFEFCQGCVLYDECELAEDYRCFRLNHPQIHKSQTPQATGALKVKAAARLRPCRLVFALLMIALSCHTLRRTQIMSAS